MNNNDSRLIGDVVKFCWAPRPSQHDFSFSKITAWNSCESLEFNSPLKRFSPTSLEKFDESKSSWLSCLRTLLIWEAGENDCCMLTHFVCRTTFDDNLDRKRYDNVNDLKLVFFYLRVNGAKHREGKSSQRIPWSISESHHHLLNGNSRIALKSFFRSSDIQMWSSSNIILNEF